MKSGSSPTSNAWVQLYEARRMINEPQARPPGRPPSIVPRTKVGLTLTKGEVTELEEWQERFSVLLGRKVSVGETVGILSRICTARLEQIQGKVQSSDLNDLVDRMVRGR
ncbi:MAG: hypothetical protein ACYC36_12195 [Bellilinea sp.]